MTTLDEEPGGELWYHAKGAPLELLERCTAIRPRTVTVRSPTPTARRYGRRSSATPPGLRVLGFAQRHVAQIEDRRASVESQLTFVGLAALEDPPRPRSQTPSRAAAARASGSSSSPATTL